MKHELEETERALEEYFAAERGRLRAPGDLWLRVENAIGQPPARFTSRWRAVAALGVAAAAIAVVLVVIGGRFGGGVPLSADQVLAGAAEALADPQRVGLTSYRAVAEFESETEAGPRLRSSTSAIIVQEVPDGSSPEDAIPVAPASEEEMVREVSRVKLAFKAPNSYLYEFENVEPPGEAGEGLFVTDGDTFWSYDSISNTYSRESIESFLMIQWSFQPGAFAGGGIAGLLQGLGFGPERTATLVGEETLLGRPVHVIEVRPGYTGSRSREDGTMEEYSGGVVRMWLDKEFLFTLRMELPQGPDDGTFEMRVTEIEFNVEVSDDLFRFEPPSGAFEVPASDDLSSRRSEFQSGPGNLHLPVGFLTPAYHPAGYRAVSSESRLDSDGRGVDAQFVVEERDGDGSFLVRELVRPDLPDTVRRGRKITINGHDAWLDTTGDGISLAWHQEGVAIYFGANGVGEAEVIRVAESMQLVEADGDDLRLATPPELVPVSPGDP